MISRSLQWKVRRWLLRSSPVRVFGSLVSFPGHNTFCTSQEFWLDGCPTFHKFINRRSFLLWEVLKKKHFDLDWLELPVYKWENHINFNEIKFILNDLSQKRSQIAGIEF